MKFTEKEIDSLLQTVEESLAKAEVLAKSNLKKDESDKDKVPPPAVDDKTPPPPAAAPADSTPPPAAPAADSVPPPAPADSTPPPADGQVSPADAGQAEPDGDEGVPPPQGEAAQPGEPEAPLSDEELNQIYGTMPPEELERHYMIIRQHLQGAYAKMEAGKEVKITDDKANGGPVTKSEAVVALEKENADMKKQMDLLSKAIQVLATPKRKAVTSMAFIKKSEADDSTKESKLSKTEIKSKLVDLTKSGKLSSDDRRAINSYCLDGTDENKIIEIIKKSEGGK